MCFDIIIVYIFVQKTMRIGGNMKSNESGACLRDIGRRLKEIRKDNKYTQEQFSEKLNMSLNFYGKIERGESRLSIEKLILLNDLFNIDINFLLTGTSSNAMDYNSVLSDCPKDKVFDFEQLIRYAKNLYK